ncbi:MAG: hypothetical protein U0470_04415 [Anaerolineae bacterium]|jgi:hypothetical protein
MTPAAPTYRARCFLSIRFAPGRTHAVCLSCDALRRVSEPRHPGTTIADDDLAAGAPEASAADRRAALAAALEALEYEWWEGRWGRVVGLLERRFRGARDVHRAACTPVRAQRPGGGSPAHR